MLCVCPLSLGTSSAIARNPWKVCALIFRPIYTAAVVVMNISRADNGYVSVVYEVLERVNVTAGGCADS